MRGLQRKPFAGLGPWGMGWDFNQPGIKSINKWFMYQPSVNGERRERRTWSFWQF